MRRWEVISMAYVYSHLIQKGLKCIDNVPNVLKEAVEKILAEEHE